MKKETASPCTTNITPTDYEVLPLNTLWPDLLPHCIDPAVQTVLNYAVREWIKERGCGADKQDEDTWDILGALDGKCAPPWELGDSCSWDMEFDHRIEEAAKNDDPLAYTAMASTQLCFMIDELRSFNSMLVSDKDQHVVEDICDRFRNHFKPKPESLDWWVIKRACHYMAPFALALAQRAFPDGDWEVLEGVFHSTVVDHQHRRCFEIMFGGYEYEPGSPHPIEFALMTGPLQGGYKN